MTMICLWVPKHSNVDIDHNERCSTASAKRGPVKRLLGFMIGILLLASGFMLGGEIGNALDCYTFVILIGGALAFTFMGHGGALWSALKAALVGTEHDTARRAQHLIVLHTLRKTLLWLGFAMALMGAISMSVGMDSWDDFGPAFGVLLLAPFYGIVFAELMLAPLINGLDVESP